MLSTGQVNKTINFWALGVKGQRHRTSKVDTETWRRCQSRPLWSSSFLVVGNRLTVTYRPEAVMQHGLPRSILSVWLSAGRPSSHSPVFDGSRRQLCHASDSRFCMRQPYNGFAYRSFSTARTHIWSSLPPSFLYLTLSFDTISGLALQYTFVHMYFWDQEHVNQY